MYYNNLNRFNRQMFFNRSKGKISKKMMIIGILLVIIIIGIFTGISFIKKKKPTKPTNTPNITQTNINNNHMILKGIRNINPIKGYWLWTWSGEGGSNPSEINDIGIRFGGESPKTAIDNNINMVSSLTSARQKFLNLGGGDNSGIWQLSDFSYINNNLSNIKSKGWDGVCFDIEVCTQGVSFVNAFADCFAKCKANGLKVLVTISHVMPYACQSGAGQGMDLINAWIKDSNIDYISPQLYGPDGKTVEPTNLSVFSNAYAKIIPSIPYDSDWDKIQNLGIQPAGYLTWLRKTSPSSASNYCGVSWFDASTNCANAPKCVSQDSECPNGLHCFAGITCSGGGGGGGGGTINLCGTNWNTVNCSTSSRCPSGTDGECPSGQKCWGNNKC